MPLLRLRRADAGGDPKNALVFSSEVAAAAAAVELFSPSSSFKRLF